MLGSHIRLRARDDRVIATSDAERRLAAEIFLEVGRDFGLLCFRLADTHSHAEIVGGGASEFARRVEIRLTLNLGIDCGFQPAFVRPIQDQRHRVNTFWYVLGQAQHHGLGSDPFHDASNLPDLLGMRILGQYTAGQVREHLPRTTRQRLLQVAGFANGPANLDRLADSAAAAAGLPHLLGNRPRAVAARSAAVRVGLEFASPAQVAGALGLAPRTLRKLRGADSDDVLVEATQRQLAVRSAVTSPMVYTAERPLLYAVGGPARTQGG